MLQFSCKANLPHFCRGNDLRLQKLRVRWVTLKTDRTPWTTEEPDCGRLITTAHARLSVINGQGSLTTINGLHGEIQPNATTTHTWNYGAGVVFR